MAVKSCPSWNQLYSVNFPEYSGYVTNLEDAIKVIKVYGVSKTTSSIIAYQTKGFGNSPVGKTRYCKFDISIIFLFSFFQAVIHLFAYLYIVYSYPLFTIKINQITWRWSLFKEKLDQYQYLGNCPPTPPQTQYQP